MEERLRVVGKGGRAKCGKGGRFKMVGKGLKGKGTVRQREGVSIVKGGGMVNGGKRDVCCLGVQEGGMGMINIDSLI